MIIYENKGYMQLSSHPDTDWTGEALYVVPDGSALAQKVIALCPYYDFVLDDNGELIDVVDNGERPPAPPPMEDRLSTLEGELDVFRKTTVAENIALRAENKEFESVLKDARAGLLELGGKGL